MEVTVTAPNRIDLAGGTTDLYPLYLLMVRLIAGLSWILPWSH